MSPPPESVRYDTLKPLETSCRTCTWNERTSAKRDRSIRPTETVRPLSVENLLRNNGPSLFVDHHRRPITRRDGILLRIQTTPFYIFYIYRYIYIFYTVPTLWSLNWPSVDDHYPRSFPPPHSSSPVQDFLCSSFTSNGRFSPLPSPFFLKRVSTLTTTILKQSSPENYIIIHHLREPAIRRFPFFNARK